MHQIEYDRSSNLPKIWLRPYDIIVSKMTKAPRILHGTRGQKVRQIPL